MMIHQKATTYIQAGEFSIQVRRGQRYARVNCETLRRMKYGEEGVVVGAVNDYGHFIKVSKSKKGGYTLQVKGDCGEFNFKATGEMMFNLAHWLSKNV
jgi:hypothetical protein